MQTQVLLSIKPKFANKIFEGKKRYEYRRLIFKSKNVKHVLVYASSPIQKVIGEFEVGGIITQEKNKVWEATKQYSGIEKEYFDEYFEGREYAHAIKIANAKRYDLPLCLSDFKIKAAPQSFVYLD